MSLLNARVSPGVLRNAAMGAWAISPPYTSMVSFQDYCSRGMPLPLGSIVCGTDRSILGRLGQLAVAVNRDPWAIPCLLLPPGEDVHGWLRELVPMLGTRLAIVKVPNTRATASIESIADAVLRRPVPTADDIVTYVALRLQSPELGNLLVHQFREALGGDPASAQHSLATYSRQFRRYGAFTARDWRAVAKLAVRLGRSTGPCEIKRRHRDSLSFAQGKTLHRHIRKYLGMSLTRARQHLGWEWAIEKALEHAGYSCDCYPSSD